MSDQANTLRELTSSELDNVGGGTVLGPKLTGVVDATAAAAADITGAVQTGGNGIVDAIGQVIN